MSADDILRLHYQERQFLGARDFQDEQAYLIESRHRNNVAHRTWGILSGLDIRETVTGNGIWIVSAGAALDAYGREIYVFEDTPLDVLELSGKLANQTPPIALKIWVTYAIEETSPAAAGFLTCEDAALNTRTRESFRFIYQDAPVPFDTQRVEDSTRWPVATQDLPDDPKEAAWPVLLGTITWSGTAISKADPAGRRYSGVRGAEAVSQTTQFDVHPAQLRLMVDAAEEAVLTTGKGSTALPAATSVLHLRTNGDSGGAGVVVDKDNVTLGQTLTVAGVTTLSDTVGNGSGKLVLEVGAGNVATLTRRNGTGSNHDLAIRTNDGAGGNTIRIDEDALALESVTVTGAAIFQGGLDTWDKIVLKQTDGTDDSDPMVISRRNTASDSNDLCVQIGDNTDTKDRFIIGPIVSGQAAITEQFIVDNAGNVTAKGGANIGGTANIGGSANIAASAVVAGNLTVLGGVNGRNMIADGIKLDAISDNAKNVAILRGNVSHGGQIPLPAGFIDPAQCVWIVIVNPPLGGAPLPPTFHTGADSRIVNSQVIILGSPFNGNADFVMIGVK